MLELEFWSVMRPGALQFYPFVLRRASANNNTADHPSHLRPRIADCTLYIGLVPD